MSVIRRLLGRLRRRPPTAARPPEPSRTPRQDGQDRRSGLRPQSEDDASIYPLF
ncbi:hypothetical protein ABZX62_26075 [Streptomyces flavidovirens]|uniref:Uncharacterized protein n=1 Tax=Streptomyces flavidovirens TaxID=67298 RepID=A0ABW6RND1_9ACTN